MEIKLVKNFNNAFMDMVTSIVEEGNEKHDRTGVGTYSQMGHAMRFDISNGKVPLLTLRDTKPQNAIVENIWFLSGDTDVKFLKDNNVGIWDEWVIPETAVFRDYTEEEYFTQYKKIYKDRPEYGNGEDPEPHKYLVYTYRDGLNWLRCNEPEIYKLFMKDHPKGTNRWVLSSFSGQQGVKIPNKKLVSGSIGSGAYGAQWRKWEDTRLVDHTDVPKYQGQGYDYVSAVNYNGSKAVITRNIDQYAAVIDQLKNNPDSRRIIVNGWNVGKIQEMSLPCCHLYHQYYTRELEINELKVRMNSRGHTYLQSADLHELQRLCKQHGIPTRTLSMFLLIRSNDLILGNVSNVFQYAVIAHMVASVVGMETEDLVWVGVDAHVYQNHVEGMYEMDNRFDDEGTPPVQTARIKINPDVKSIDDFKVSDIELVDYVFNKKPIVFPIAV